MAFGRIAVAAAVMGVTVFVAESGLSHLLPGDGLGLQAVRLGTTIVAGLVVLAASARVLRIREFDDAFALVATRLRRTS